MKKAPENRGLGVNLCLVALEGSPAYFFFGAAFFFFGAAFLAALFID